MADQQRPNRNITVTQTAIAAQQKQDDAATRRVDAAGAQTEVNKPPILDPKIVLRNEDSQRAAASLKGHKILSAAFENGAYRLVLTDGRKLEFVDCNLLSPAPGRAFPHEIACVDCIAAQRCNTCGEDVFLEHRCGNGRCFKCCRTACKVDAPHRANL